MSQEFDTVEKPGLCRMEVKVWLSGCNPELEEQKQWTLIITHRNGRRL